MVSKNSMHIHNDAPNQLMIVVQFTICILLSVQCSFCLLFLKKRRKQKICKPSIKLTNPRGILLDNLLKQKKGQKLTSDQRSIIANNIGLYKWLPEDLIAPWEERILCFLQEFPITYMKKEMPT